MRKWNAILSAVILILFLMHGVAGALELTGIGNTALKHLARAMIILIALHVIIGIYLTGQTFRAWKRTGVLYWKENRLFWIRRFSGLAVLLSLGLHISAFGYIKNGALRLRFFNKFHFAAQILLILSLALHVSSNIRPLMIAFGIENGKKWLLDILLILSAWLLFMAAAFLIYYLRWNIW